MSLLIFTYRHQDIIKRKADLNFKLMNLKQKMMDLQTYASDIADGTVSMNDLMTAPASMFNRMSIFMMSSHQAAMSGASEKFSLMSQIPGSMPQMQNAQLQEQYSNMMFKNLYDQEREKFGKTEQKILNDQDTKIQQECAKIESQLKLLDAEESKVTESEDKAAEKSAPKYTA